MTSGFALWALITYYVFSAAGLSKGVFWHASFMVLAFGLVFPLGLAALVRGDTTRMYHMQLNRLGTIAVFVGWLSITFGSSVHFPGTNTTVKGLHGLSGLTVLIACCLQTVTG